MLTALKYFYEILFPYQIVTVQRQFEHHLPDGIVSVVDIVEEGEVERFYEARQQFGPRALIAPDYLPFARLHGLFGEMAEGRVVRE